MQLEVAYSGSFCLTIETKLDLYKAPAFGKLERTLHHIRGPARTTQGPPARIAAPRRARLRAVAGRALCCGKWLWPVLPGCFAMDGTTAPLFDDGMVRLCMQSTS